VKIKCTACSQTYDDVYRGTAVQAHRPEEPFLTQCVRCGSCESLPHNQPDLRERVRAARLAEVQRKMQEFIESIPKHDVARCGSCQLYTEHTFIGIPPTGVGRCVECSALNFIPSDLRRRVIARREWEKVQRRILAGVPKPGEYR
jgi:hypothetical protein